VADSRHEALWVLRAQCGDRAALESLLRSVQPAIRRYLAGLVGSTDADDVLQEVLLLICRKLGWLNDPELFRPWAFRTASRAAFRHLQKRNRWAKRFDEEAAAEDVPAEAPPADRHSIVELLARHRISPACSTVLRLHFEEQMSLAEVAAVLEIPVGTVKSRLAYGLAALRERLTNRRS
jgi:RNA polymerase sigma-70 factor (ECF subfamily)